MIYCTYVAKNRSKSYKMWHIGQNTSNVKNPTEILTPIFAENIKWKISDLIGQTWGIRSNTSQMWTVWPNSTKLSHILQNTSHVKNPTEFLTPIFADNVSCKIFDRLCQTWKIQWYTTRLWKKRHMWKMRPNFSHLYSPKVCRLFDIWPNIAHVSNSIEFFTAVKNFHRIRQSHDIFDRIHHMWKFRPNFSHIYSPKISHVKYPTEYIKREEFDRIRHRREQLDLIRDSYDIQCIRQNSSHVKNPTEFLTPIFADNATCNLLDRLYQTWVIQWNSAHMCQKSIEFIQDVTYWTDYITCEKSDRISHTYICRKYQM